MLRRDSSVPLYMQIKDFIRRNIDNGEYAENTRIPSERQLAEQFDVSRLTVTKAVSELVQEGLLQTRVGKGTYVSSNIIDQEVNNLTSFSQDMQQRGQKATSRVISASVTPASKEIARILQIDLETPIMELKRVRLADNAPLALEISRIPASLCPNILEKYDFSRESLYRVLQENYGLNLLYAQQSFEARMAEDHEIKALGISKNAPILSIVRVTYNEQEHPIEYVRSAYRGDKYKFYATLRQGEL